MVIRLLRWFRRHPILTAFLALFSYSWIKWMTFPPDWYLVHTFSLKKDALDRLVIMLREDFATYDPVNQSSDKGCCVVRLDDFGEVKPSMTSEMFTEERIQGYSRLLVNAGVYHITQLHDDINKIWIGIDYYFVGGSVNYLYSEEPLPDCARQIHEITGGMPAYDCTRLDEHWYLFHIEG